MKKIERITIQHTELPQILEVVGKNDMREFYEIKPAAKKLGACLGKVQPMLDRILRQQG